MSSESQQLYNQQNAYNPLKGVGDWLANLFRGGDRNKPPVDPWGKGPGEPFAPLNPGGPGSPGHPGVTVSDPKTGATWSVPYYDAPKADAPASQATIDQLGTEIARITRALDSSPDWGGGATASAVTRAQDELDALTAARDRMAADLATTTTLPPTAEQLLGSDPELLRLFNDSGRVASTSAATGYLSIDPAKFKEDVQGGRLMYHPVLDIDPATGASIQRFDIPRVLTYADPASAMEEAWNTAHYTQAYQSALEKEGFTPAVAGTPPPGASPSIEERYMTMLEGLMKQLGAPQAAAPGFVSREQAAAAGEAKPLEATAGIQSGGVDASQLLGMLLNNFGGGQ